MSFRCILFHCTHLKILKILFFVLVIFIGFQILSCIYNSWFKFTKQPGRWRFNDFMSVIWTCFCPKTIKTHLYYSVSSHQNACCPCVTVDESICSYPIFIFWTLGDCTTYWSSRSSTWLFVRPIQWLAW